MLEWHQSTLPVLSCGMSYRTIAPSPHAAASCIGTCEPALREFLRRTTKTRRTVSEARVVLDRFSAQCAVAGVTPARANEVTLLVAAHIERLDAEVEKMHSEITGLRDTTVREIYRHCAPAHHPLVSGLHHLAVRPPLDPPPARRPQDRE